MAVDLPPETRGRVLEHVLAAVHADRDEAEVVGVTPTDGGHLVGVKAYPSGYLSSAAYALVTVDGDGGIVDAEPCTGLELRDALASDEP